MFELTEEGTVTVDEVTITVNEVTVTLGWTEGGRWVDGHKKW